MTMKYYFTSLLFLALCSKTVCIFWTAPKLTVLAFYWHWICIFLLYFVVFPIKSVEWFQYLVGLKVVSVNLAIYTLSHITQLYTQVSHSIDDFNHAIVPCTLYHTQNGRIQLDTIIVNTGQQGQIMPCFLCQTCPGQLSRNHKKNKAL